jgi:integrase
MSARNPNPARRTKVKGKQGIYYRQVGKQRRYEITYLDSDGRRRWQTVPGFDNLDDAEATLVETKSKLHRGERVAPGKLTFNEAVDMWFAGKNVAERTRERYESNLRLYLRPRFGDRRVHEITAEDVAALVAEMRAKGKAGWTQRNVLTTLSGFYTWASSPRRRYAPANPVSQLEHDERPKVRKRKGRVLQPDEIRALLDSATTDRYRVLIASAIFSGLRLMELLALRWQDVGDNEIYVRHQLSRKGKRLVDVKTDSAERDVALRPELAAMLKRHKMASRFKQPHDFVFAAETGGPLGWRNVERRAMDAAHAAAVKAKRLPASRPKPVLHDCRHTYGAMLVAEGRDVHTVKTMMGHANVATTIDVYGGDFDKARNADPNAPRPNYGNVLETAPGDAGLRLVAAGRSASQNAAS